MAESEIFRRGGVSLTGKVSNAIKDRARSNQFPAHRYVEPERAPLLWLAVSHRNASGVSKFYANNGSQAQGTQIKDNEGHLIKCSYSPGGLAINGKEEQILSDSTLIGVIVQSHADGTLTIQRGGTITIRNMSNHTWRAGQYGVLDCLTKAGAIKARETIREAEYQQLGLVPWTLRPVSNSSRDSLFNGVKDPSLTDNASTLIRTSYDTLLKSIVDVSVATIRSDTTRSAADTLIAVKGSMDVNRARSEFTANVDAYSRLLHTKLKIRFLTDASPGENCDILMSF